MQFPMTLRVGIATRFGRSRNLPTWVKAQGLRTSTGILKTFRVFEEKKFPPESLLPLLNCGSSLRFNGAECFAATPSVR